MRIALAAAAAMAALALAAAAEAQPALEGWTAPNALFSIERPAAWPVEDMSQPGGPKEYVAGNADEECWFTVIDRPETARATGARLVQAFSQPLPAETWMSVARVQRLFTNAQPTLVGSGVDVSKPFPVQTADFTHPEKGAIIAALHARPGLEVYAFCAQYVPGDKSGLFRAIAASFTTPKDAELLAPPVAAPAAPPPPPAPEPRRRSRN